MAHRLTARLGFAGAIALAASGVASIPDVPDRHRGGAQPCVVADRPMTDTITRMFALTATGSGRILGCWTRGEADLESLTAYVAAGPPADLEFEHEHTRGARGILFAAVRVRATWAGEAPAGWVPGQLQTAVMRQRRDWGWSIEAIRPRTRAAMATDPHCGICHR